MNRKTLIQHINERYGIAPDYPWRKYPDYAVFRHPGQRKWFCLLMTLPGDKLGLADSADVDIINLKAAPEMVGSLLQMAGVFPAWHMNKEHWVSLILQGGQSDAGLRTLIDDSFCLTRNKRRS